MMLFTKILETGKLILERMVVGWRNKDLPFVTTSNMSDRHSCGDIQQAGRYVSQKFWEDEFLDTETLQSPHVNIRVVLNLRTLNCRVRMEPQDSIIFRVGK